MAQTIAWLLFVVLHCAVVHRWTHDFRHGLEPWLRRQATKLRVSRRFSEPHAAWLSVLLVMIAVFSPVVVIWIAGRYGAISWSLAYLLLLLTLALSATLWMSPVKSQRETR